MTSMLAGSGVAGSLRSLKSDDVRILLICLVAWTLTNLDQSLFGYAIPGLMAEFDITLEFIGVILSICFLFTIVSTIIVGLLADRYGRRLTLGVCLALSALMVALTGFAGSVMMLIIYRALGFGLSNGLSPITSAYVTESAPQRWRGLMMGILMCGYPLGWFLASLLAAPLIESHGWRAIFYCAFAVVPLAWLLYKLLPESAQFVAASADSAGQPDWRARIGEVLGPVYRRRTILCMLAFFSYGGAYAGTAFYFPTFFEQARGYDAATAARVVGTAYGIGVIGYLGAAIVGEFVTTRRNTAIIWCWLGAASLLALVWLPTTEWQDVLCFGLLAMFFYGASAVMLTFTTELFPTRLRATAAAVSASSGLNLGFAIFPVLVARGVEAVGWEWTFSLTAAPCLVLSGLFMLGLQNRKSNTGLDEIDADAGDRPALSVA
jgi:MFS family permease